MKLSCVSAEFCNSITLPMAQKLNCPDNQALKISYRVSDTIRRGIYVMVLQRCLYRLTPTPTFKNIPVIRIGVHAES